MALAGIPLHCNICPKKPTFSDVSHLLTHIASKGHLSHYYKLKVRSSTEGEARGLIEAYDLWYMEWGVEDLMSERMNLKDKKRCRSRTAKPSHRNVASSYSQNRPRAAPAALDPRLAGVSVKTEPRPTPSPIYAPQAYPQAYLSRMQTWPSASPGSFASGETTPFDYEFPNVNGDRFHRGGFFADLPNESAIADDNDDIDYEETLKLKGVQWPGMAIFDSATPEMRRKRNQKKDVSVLEQLEASSKDVEPTELVFTRSISFKRVRRISASSMDECSSIKDEFSPGPEQQFIRPAMMDLDPNRSVRSRPSSSTHTKPISQDPFYENSPDFGLRIGDIAPQKKHRPFDVFHDQTTAATYQTQPASFNYLTSEYHTPRQEENNYMTQQPKTNSSLYRIGGKENYNDMGYSNGAAAFYSFQQPQSQTQYQPYATQAPVDPNSNFMNNFNPMYFNAHNSTFIDTSPMGQDLDDQRTITAPPSDGT